VGNALVSSSRDRRAGMLEEAGKAGFVIEEVEGAWTTDRAREAVYKWLVRARIRDAWPDLVGCQNDEMALGAREALLQAAQDFERPALARLPVTGGDGLPELGRKWVAEGKAHLHDRDAPTSERRSICCCASGAGSDAGREHDVGDVASRTGPARRQAF
jgi:ABC-type sugar transport system substrate-binding protein